MASSHFVLFCHKASVRIIPFHSFGFLPAPNRAAVIIGTTVGSLLLIFILLVFIAILYWKLSNRRRYEKEFSNEIRYCAAPQRQQGTVKHLSSMRVR